MKHEALAAAITGIDEDLLQDAATVPPAPRRPVFGRWSAMAAAVLLVIGLSVLWQQSGVLRLSVGETVIGSSPVALSKPADPSRGAEPALYSAGELVAELTLTGRGAWQLTASAGELQVAQGNTVSEWSVTQSGSGRCTIRWVIPQPTAGSRYSLTVNTQTVTLSQNEQGVWMIQKTS